MQVISVDRLKGCIKQALVIFLFSYFISGCASSNVSRDASNNIEMGVQNAKNMAQAASDNSLEDTYQNASQATKGALLGASTGAVTGALSSSIGIVPGLASGAIIGAAYGAYIDSNTTLTDKLVNRKVKVVELGDQILVVIPSAQLFHAMSPQIKPQGASTLDLVAQYISGFTTMAVKVAAYSNATGPQEINRILTQKQADNVARYLWTSGVNTRLISAMGYGGTHLVEENSVEWDESENYRIEISLEKFPT